MLFLFGSFCECLFLIRSYYYIYTVCHCFWGVYYLWSQKRGTSCASFLNLWSHFEMLQIYHTFLLYIDDISVIICCKNSYLVVKHPVKLAYTPKKAWGCESHWGYTSTYIYTNTQKWFFEGVQIVAVRHFYAWQTPFFGYNCGAGAEQLNF